MKVLEECDKINEQILIKEKRLLRTAPDDIKKLYLEIDYLVNKQILLREMTLTNN